MTVWRDWIPGWPLRGAIDLAPVADPVLAALAASPADAPWCDASPWRVRELVLVPSEHDDLAEAQLRQRHDRIDAAFRAAAREQRALLPAAPRADTVAVVLSADRGNAIERLRLVDWVWTLQVRRLMWLRERPDKLAELQLTPWDLSDLDELYETEYHYSRARIEQQRHDGAVAVLVMGRVAAAPASR